MAENTVDLVSEANAVAGQVQEAVSYEVEHTTSLIRELMSDASDNLDSVFSDPLGVQSDTLTAVQEAVGEALQNLDAIAQSFPNYSDLSISVARELSAFASRANTEIMEAIASGSDASYSISAASDAMRLHGELMSHQATANTQAVTDGIVSAIQSPPVDLMTADPEAIASVIKDTMASNAQNVSMTQDIATAVGASVVVDGATAASSKLIELAGESVTNITGDMAESLRIIAQETQASLASAPAAEHAQIQADAVGAIQQITEVAVSELDTMREISPDLEQIVSQTTDVISVIGNASARTIEWMGSHSDGPSAIIDKASTVMMDNVTSSLIDVSTSVHQALSVASLQAPADLVTNAAVDAVESLSTDMLESLRIVAQDTESALEAAPVAEHAQIQTDAAEAIQQITTAAVSEMQDVASMSSDLDGVSQEVIRHLHNIGDMASSSMSDLATADVPQVVVSAEIQSAMDTAASLLGQVSSLSAESITAIQPLATSADMGAAASPVTVSLGSALDAVSSVATETATASQGMMDTVVSSIRSIGGTVGEQLSNFSSAQDIVLMSPSATMAIGAGIIAAFSIMYAKALQPKSATDIHSNTTAPKKASFWSFGKAELSAAEPEKDYSKQGVQVGVDNEALLQPSHVRMLLEQSQETNKSVPDAAKLVVAALKQGKGSLNELPLKYCTPAMCAMAVIRNPENIKHVPERVMSFGFAMEVATANNDVLGHLDHTSLSESDVKLITDKVASSPVVNMVTEATSVAADAVIAISSPEPVAADTVQGTLKQGMIDVIGKVPDATPEQVRSAMQSMMQDLRDPEAEVDISSPSPSL